MWKRMVTALVCLLTLLVEVGLDSSTSFVRAEPPVSSVQSMKKVPVDDPFHGSESPASSRDEVARDLLHLETVAHSASPAFSFVVDPVLGISRFQHPEPGIPSSPEEWVPLRPPIS